MLSLFKPQSPYAHFVPFKLHRDYECERDDPSHHHPRVQQRLRQKHALKPKDNDYYQQLLEYEPAGVSYYDSQQRKNFYLKVVNGALRKGKKPYDTTRESCTDLSGEQIDNFAIAVLDIYGDLYSGPHLSERHHHSSYVSGADIYAGIVWRVHRGVPLYISAFSGHYLNEDQDYDHYQLVQFLLHLQAEDVPLSDCRVNTRPYRDIKANPKKFKLDPEADDNAEYITTAEAYLEQHQDLVGKLLPENRGCCDPNVCVIL